MSRVFSTNQNQWITEIQKAGVFYDCWERFLHEVYVVVILTGKDLEKLQNASIFANIAMK